MVLALISAIPHSLPTQTNRIQLQREQKKGMWIWLKWSHKSHVQTHTDWQHTYTKHTHKLSVHVLLYIYVFNQMLKWTICCGCQSRTALCSGRQVLRNDWKIKASWKANLTPFLLWWLSGLISCCWVARRLGSCTRTVGVFIHLCSTRACMHIHTKEGVTGSDNGDEV